MVLQRIRKKMGPAGLIAPCGMNCALCAAYQREQNKCPGCRGDDTNKPKTRATCKIKWCSQREGAEADFCTRCPQFPCKLLLRLNRRYRAKYAMSMIDNLLCIEEAGMPVFLKRERAKWSCPGCGALLCVHKDHCLVCQRPWR